MKMKSGNNKTKDWSILGELSYKKRWTFLKMRGLVISLNNTIQSEKCNKNVTWELSLRKV